MRERIQAGWRVLVGMVVAYGGASAATAAEATKDQIAKGQELFLREWVPGDNRTHGGDGLGPVYNDSSCVACHNAGAPGGGGPNSKNVDILTAAPMLPVPQQQVIQAAPKSFARRAFEELLGIESKTPATPLRPAKIDTTELVKAHTGFRTARSVVLHKFATEPSYPGLADLDDR